MNKMETRQQALKELRKIKTDYRKCNTHKLAKKISGMMI